MAQETGPFLSEQHFNELIQCGERMAAAAGTRAAGPKLLAEPSYIPVASRPAVAGAGILAVDVGGTHIKVGLRTARKDGRLAWQELLDVDNDALNIGGDAVRGLEKMAIQLARLIVTKLEKARISKNTIKAVGVVWSNALKNAPLELESARGVTGVVTGSQDGKAYRKGEWWNRDIQDGDDIGQIFIRSFAANGITPRAFVIGNDTIFTAKAIDQADAGMVASTGANATIIPAGQQMLCNSESGGNFEIPVHMLNLPPIDGQPAVKLEDIMAGKNMPMLLAEYIVQAGKQGTAEFSRLGDSIIEKKKSGKPAFSSEDVSMLLQGNFEEFLKNRDLPCYPAETLAALKRYAERLISISGRMAAAMAYLSILNQLPEKSSFTLALDSSQARYQTGYFESMKAALKTLLGPKGKQLNIQLLEPEGEISVPMMGVARAANDFL